MQSRKGLRLFAFIAAPIGGFALVAMVSCRDTPTANKISSNDDALVTPPTTLSPGAIRLRLHQKNPYEWVGFEHNRALDDFRKEMEKPGRLTTNACAYISHFVNAPERLPADKRTAARHADSTATAKALATTRLCQWEPSRVQPTGAFPSERPMVTTTMTTMTTISMQESSAVYPLLANIEAAVEASANSYEFASRLSPIVDAALALEPTDREIVLAVVSVAQNSFEYWESQYPAFVQTFSREYDDCASESANLGYSGDEGRSRCLGSGMTDVRSRETPRPKPTPAIRFASLMSDDDCDLPLRFKKLIGADVRGAIVGALSSIWIPGGILFGAFRGAAAASLAIAFDGTWDLFWCAMR